MSTSFPTVLLAVVHVFWQYWILHVRIKVSFESRSIKQLGQLHSLSLKLIAYFPNFTFSIAYVHWNYLTGDLHLMPCSHTSVQDVASFTRDSRGKEKIIE